MSTKNTPPDNKSEANPDASPEVTNTVELPVGYEMPEDQALTQEVGDMLRAKLLGETAKAPWSELQRFFAQGVVLMAAPGVNMISVAAALAEDDRESFEGFLSAKEAGPVTDEQALRWIETDATLWTVVVKPWVLVQEILVQEILVQESDS